MILKLNTPATIDAMSVFAPMVGDAFGVDRMPIGVVDRFSTASAERMALVIGASRKTSVTGFKFDTWHLSPPQLVLYKH